MSELVLLAASASLPALVTAAGGRAERRFLEFFAATIRNPHTRRAYARAVADFLAWCDARRVPALAAVQPLHVAAWVEQLGRERSAPTVKLRLAAVRHLFDWLVTGGVVPVNPAAPVRGPRHVVRQGKTPVLDPAEARRLLDAIDVTTHAGLRDRALIALMVHAFARVGAALAMTVEDVFVQQRRLWVRLREKGGKAHAMPCHTAATIAKLTTPAMADEIGIVARQGQQRLALGGGEDGTTWHGEDSGAADRPGNT